MLENAVHGSYQVDRLLNEEQASESLDSLMHFVSELLPVNDIQYPDIRSFDQTDTIAFCLHHSALHFSKTAGKLAAFVEEADHGRFAQIQALEAIVASSLVNSLKLADEIGLTGNEIMSAVRQKFAQRVEVVQQT